MKRLIYSVAMSLDGYIARENGSYDWIPSDPTIDWDAFMGRFEAVLMGRRTYEVAAKEGMGSLKGMKVYVFSQSIVHGRVTGGTLVTGDPLEAVRQLKADAQKDLWLMGGGDLFGSLLDAGHVDVVEVAVVPIILGGGIPFVRPGNASTRLILEDSRLYESGIMLLTYSVAKDADSRPHSQD